jgi:hypothetical protein
MNKCFMLFLAVACLRTAAANTFTVPAGGDLQAALNQVRPGDTVLLTPGATYTGHFTLAPNPGPQWITIQSAAIASLPAAGTRVAPANAPLMPKIVTPDSDPVLAINGGANYYRLQGLEFNAAPGIYVQDLIRIGTTAESSNAQLPHDLDFDRDYIHGDPAAGGKRGIALNGGTTTIENSYFSTFISTGQDTQAICGWNGPGPYTIANNYLEAGSEIVAFGGAYVSIPLNTPSDIVIKNNTFFKPLSWRVGDPSYAGFPVFAKNHIELKNAQRVTIDSNTFTNNWIWSDQQGFMLVFGVRTEGGMVPWAVVNDVTVTNNIFRHSAAGALLMGHDGFGGSASRFLIKNNIWEDLSPYWSGDGRLFQVQDSVNGATFDHNTAFEAGWLCAFAVNYSFNINFTNNILNIGAGVIGAGAGVGSPSLAAYDIGGTFANNVIIGNSLYPYPASNVFASTIDQVGFVNYNAENFLLAANSPYKGMANDGTDPGANLPATGSISSLPTNPTGWVNLVAKHSGKCLDITGASTALGATATQYACWGGDNQKFQLTPVSGGYSIIAKHSGLALDILGGASVNWGGAPVDQWGYWGGESQIWQLVPTADGYYNLKPASDGLCMAVAGASPNNSAPVIQWSCYGGDEQKWSLVPAR